MKRAYIALHIAVILAGFTAIFGRLITLTEVPLVWFRVFLSSIFLFGIMQLYRVPQLKSASEILKVGRVGLLITIHWVFFYASIKYSNISIGVVCYCLTSFFTAFLAPIINKKPFDGLQFFLSGLTLFGISLIFHFDVTYQLGIFLGVISSLFAALYTIYNEKLVRHYDSRIINFYQMVGGTIGLGLFIPLYLWFFPDALLMPSTRDTIYLCLLALFCTAGLYILFAEALKSLSAFTVNLSFNLEPIYAIIIAFIFFKEGQMLNGSFYVGLGFVILSVVLQAVFTARNKK